MSRKPREFTADSPLVIEIVQRATGWTIQPHVGFITKMRNRLKDPDPIGPNKHLEDRILQEWTGRNGQTPKPPFLSDSEHIPIIIREGEFVQFVCDQQLAFDIWVEKNSNVAADPTAPADPFGWNGAHQSVVAGGSLFAAVTIPPLDVNGNPTQHGPREQGFYKFRARVYQGAVPIPVDPDGYCDR
jgi:hypothetical protein